MEPVNLDFFHSKSSQSNTWINFEYAWSNLCRHDMKLILCQRILEISLFYQISRPRSCQCVVESGNELGVYWMCIGLGVYLMFIVCVMGVYWVCSLCLWGDYWMCTGCLFGVYWMCTINQIRWLKKICY